MSILSQVAKLNSAYTFIMWGIRWIAITAAAGNINSECSHMYKSICVCIRSNFITHKLLCSNSKISLVRTVEIGATSLFH